MRFSVVNLGCKVNAYECEGVARQLEEAGFERVDWEEPASEKESVSLGIGTLESYLKLRDYYGEERMLPVYIEVDDGIRLQRALDREKQQKTPNYAELCRRFLADQQDFSEEKLKEAGIRKRYRNDVLPDCLARIAEDVIHYV